MQTQRAEHRIQRTQKQRRDDPLTIGDIAQAIAGRTVSAVRQGDDYIVRVTDLLRLQRQARGHLTRSQRPDTFDMRFHEARG